MRAKNDVGRTTRRIGSSRLTLAHGLMVMAGLLTFLLVATVLRDRGATVEVWVADDSIAAGSTLDVEQLLAVELDADDPLLPSLVIVDLTVPSGRVRQDLAPGDPLLRSHLVAEGVVAAGRSFTIPVDPLVLDGLGLTRGDRLDIIGIGADEQVHYIVVDVAVTRLPTPNQGSAFASASARTSWVTVEVDEQQALELSEARLHGDLQLVRSTGAQAVAGEGDLS